ncbi:osteoclast-stimulating factor 1-like [Apostichopus japonicus]|uniref:osteoclast-stimulating factor 1-like n=1 Tax=Stichopus japonicus TaxID=307972 RepID=UPI003AB5F65C
MTTPSRPAPPKPVSKPGKVKVFRALYTYTAQYNDELSFDEGDLLYVTDNSSKDWYKGKCGQKFGLIPSNYVEESMESVDNPLHEAAKRGNVGFLQECLNNKVSVNGLDKSGSTALYWACHGGHTECIKILLATPRVELNSQNKIGDTALHAAAWKGHPEAVKLLLAKGARTDLRNKDAKYPVDLSSRDPATAAMLVPKITRIDDDDYLDEDEDEG